MSSDAAFADDAGITLAPFRLGDFDRHQIDDRLTDVSVLGLHSSPRRLLAYRLAE